MVTVRIAAGGAEDASVFVASASSPSSSSKRSSFPPPKKGRDALTSAESELDVPRSAVDVVVVVVVVVIAPLLVHMSKSTEQESSKKQPGRQVGAKYEHNNHGRRTSARLIDLRNNHGARISVARHIVHGCATRKRCESSLGGGVDCFGTVCRQ